MPSLERRALRQRSNGRAIEAVSCARMSAAASGPALLTKPDTYAGGPILDGKIVTRMPGEVLRRRAAARVPVPIGSTTDDLPVLFPRRDDPLSFCGVNARSPG